MKYEFRIFSVHPEILQFCFLFSGMMYKKIWRLPQETSPVLAITSVNQVYLHKRSTEAQSARTLCHETMPTKSNTEWKQSKIFDSCYSKMIRLTTHFVYFCSLGSFFYNTGIFRINKTNQKIKKSNWLPFSMKIFQHNSEAKQCNFCLSYT